MRNCILTVLFCFTLLITASAQTCDCFQNLDSLVQNVEQDYVGFADKVNNSSRKPYQFLKDSLLNESKTAKGYGCYLLLRKYLQFFKDPHLVIGILKPQNVDTNMFRELFFDLPKVTVSEPGLVKYYQTNKLDPIEGIWKNPLLKYRVAIFKDSTKANSYKGIALEGDGLFWYPGQIKMEIYKPAPGEYKMTYYKNDHTTDNCGMSLDSSIMTLDGYGFYENILKEKRGVQAPAKRVVSFSKPNKETCVITISSFVINQKKTIDSIIAANQEVIITTRYLIIDLRNNNGGHIMSSNVLLPFVYSRPIVHDGFIVRSSPNNIALYEHLMKNPDFSESVVKAFGEIVQKLKDHPGTLVKIDATDTLRMDKVMRYPEKVAILVNGKTVSAAEQFLLNAKQSSKVTIFGTNTKGALDYTEIGDGRSLPCIYYNYICPMGMSDHQITPYIDNVGIKPDVRIKKSVKDWLGFVYHYYSTHK